MLDEARSRLRDAEAFRVRGFVRLRGGDSGVQGDRGDQDPRATSELTMDGVNGRAALGISLLPGSAANTVW